MYMPFGKYQGRAICDLPHEYVRWLDSIDLREPLRTQISEELAARRSWQEYRRARATLKRKLDLSGWYSKLVERFHPDNGGSPEAMEAVDAAKELLERILG